MNIEQAITIQNFLNAHEPNLEKWVAILNRQGEHDRYSIGARRNAQGNELVVIYEPISVLSVIIDRGKSDRSDLVDSAIRHDDDLWEVLYMVYVAVRNGGWDKV